MHPNQKASPELPRAGARGSSRAFRRVLLLGLFCLGLPSFGAVSVSLKEVLARAQAVAHVRVTKLTETLHDNDIQRLVTFSVCGQGFGLGETKEIEAHFNSPPKTESEGAPTADPPFAIARQFVLVLARHDNTWEILHRLPLTEEGRFVESNLGEEVGLKPGLEASAVVQLLSAKIGSAEQRQRPKPPPTARNQPWNLMRSSPLRRVWPFLPH